MHYNYLCTFGESKACSCPAGKSCSILLTPEDTARYGLMDELVCGPILDDPLIHMPDTLPQINVVLGDCIPQGSYEDSGGGDDTPPPPPPPAPLCLDRKIYEKRVGSYTIGLYFSEPDDANPSLPVVLLVHGMGAQCSRWDHNYAGWFAEDRYRVAVVNLFPHNREAPPEAQGWMFHPNGTQLNELIDILHSYITRNYHGWNNKIIVIAHSRAGLEMEDVLYIRHNEHVDGVITIGTPFYGSKIADLGVGFCNVSPFLACSGFILDNTKYWTCVGAVKFAQSTLCDDFPPDMYILTTPAVTNWRRLTVDDRIIFNPVEFHVAVGWTPEWKCGPFSGLNQAGCVIMRYLLGTGCNDGAVTFSVNYDRWNNFRPKTTIFSRAPDDFRRICSGNPQEWEKDHTQVVEAHDVYSRVRDEVLSFLSYSYASIPEGPVPFSYPKSLPEEYPVEVFSRSYLTAIDASNLIVQLDAGEDSVLIWSKRPLAFNFSPAVDTQNLGAGRLYEIHPHAPVLDIRVSGVSEGSEDELEDYASDPVAIFFADGAPLYVWLNKNTYLEGEPILLKVVYPDKDTVFATFLNTSTGRTYPVVGFYERGDTSITTTSLPEEGLYKLFVWSYKKDPNGLPAAPRTAVATVLVVKNVDMDRIMGVLTGKYPGKGDTQRRDGDGPIRSTVRGDYLRVHLKKGTYRIYTLSGYRVKTGQIENGLVPLSDLRHGVFFVVVGRRTYKVVR